MSHDARKLVFAWFPTRSDTNRPVKSQKMVRGWKSRIYKVEELYYLCSDKKGADKLCSYCKADHCKADLHLCFRIGKKSVGSYCITIPQSGSFSTWLRTKFILLLNKCGNASNFSCVVTFISLNFIFELSMKKQLNGQMSRLI